MILFAALAGCGGTWTETSIEDVHADFAFECGHIEATCDSCHDPTKVIESVDTECLSCHVEDRPESHDPATTGTCEECHSACGWDAASPHPSDFDDPKAHGMIFKLQDTSEGDCLDCHGADLTGNTAGGCDDCHADEGFPDWRTDCTFCHGGDEGATGAPPRDIDGAITDISLTAHTAHVDVSADYRSLACLDCHTDVQNVLDLGHVIDDTPAVAEVDFSGGPAFEAVWDGTTCVDNYCHGAGQRHDGVIDDGSGAVDCESCHPTEQGGWSDMSGLHQAHLASDPTPDAIVCNDCHAPVIDATGLVSTPNRHVDGTRDVAFVETNITTDDGGGTCAGTCHGVDHIATGWGHPPGYDEPELHGYDANHQILECTACHGANFDGGIAQSCDTCHAQEGNPDWKTDCTYCHGGTVDNTGAPPEDIDDNVDEETISFGAHPEHTTGAGLGHPVYTCDECHATPANALSPGHMIDGTAGVAEVDLVAGLSAVGGWDATTTTCSNLYCHGDGRGVSGDIADGSGALDCDSCHATTTGLDQMSGTHATHLDVPDVTCADCHQPIVDASGTIVVPDRHVDGALDFDAAATGYNASTSTCTIDCHGTDHQGYGWLGPHPDGYDAPEVHGQESLAWVLDCTPCHSADLQGGTSGEGCDDCHTQEGHADWRTDCTFCHGGELDNTGAPPQDIDNQADESLISFKGHPEHIDGDIHPLWGCEVCHGTPSANYSDALTDLGHWDDATGGFAENIFTGLASGTTYANGTCANNICHGNGQTPGSQADANVSLDCNGCHSYDAFLTDLSGTHATHLGEAGVTCADCHSPIVDAQGTITTPNLHVNGNTDFDTVATGYSAGSDTCTINCHNTNHTGWSWEGGHPPGYDAPDIHGQDALFVSSDCLACHGTDLLGGSSGQGCDTCHDAGWRQDCTFCHGGTNDNTGMPPADLDNTTNESQITFMAHPEHGDNNDHPRYDCSECHGNASDNFSDALTDPGHWFDATAGIAEVEFDGLSNGGTYNNGTCSNLYCHGDGRNNGSETDSANGLGCTGCHSMPPSSGDHRDHEHNEYPCAECHADTVDTNDNIIGPNIHVDGTDDVDMNNALNNVTWNNNAKDCDGSCHGEGHSSEDWY